MRTGLTDDLGDRSRQAGAWHVPLSSPAPILLCQMLCGRDNDGDVVFPKGLLYS